MFCQKCGKEISDQAKFCNYCGNPVSSAQPQTPPQPQLQPQNAAPAAPQATDQPAPAKKKGKTVLSIVLVAAVFFGAKFISQSFVASTQNRDSGSQSSQTTSSETSSEVQSAVASCIYGGLYENNSFRYGMTRLIAPGYSLLAGEGDERDWLISSDDACLMVGYKQLEILGVSQKDSNAEAMLESYRKTYGDAKMIDFQKYNVNGFPVIRYIVEYTDAGVHQYQGELIVFPSEPAKETIRLDVFVDLSSGYGRERIDAIFDTLEVSTSLAVKSEETQTMGLNRITVK